MHCANYFVHRLARVQMAPMLHTRLPTPKCLGFEFLIFTASFNTELRLFIERKHPLPVPEPGFVGQQTGTGFACI